MKDKSTKDKKPVQRIEDPYKVRIVKEPTQHIDCPNHWEGKIPKEWGESSTL